MADPAPTPAPSAPPAGDGPATGAEPASAPEKPQAPAATTKFKVKVRGAEREVDADTYHAWAQKAAAGETGLEEVARQRKEFEAERGKAAQERERIKRETDKVLREAGVDPDEWAAKYLLERLGPEGQGLSPEQQQLREAQEQLAKYQEQEKTAAERAKQERLQKAALAKGQEYRKKFAAGLAELGLKEGDPSIPGLIMRMAREQQQAESEGLDLPPRALAELATESLRSEQAMAWGRLEGDALLAAIGPEVEKRVVAAAVAKRKREMAGRDPITGQAAPRPRRPDGTFDSATSVSRERREFVDRLGIKTS